MSSLTDLLYEEFRTTSDKLTCSYDSTGADSAHDSSKALLVLKQHVYEETVEFHVGCEALQSRLLSLWSRDAASSAPTEFTPEASRRRNFNRQLLRCMSLLLRCAVVSIQKAEWGIAVSSVDMETLLGFCVPAGSPVIDKPHVREWFESAARWVSANKPLLIGACVGAGIALAGASYALISSSVVEELTKAREHLSFCRATASTSAFTLRSAETAVQHRERDLTHLRVLSASAGVGTTLASMFGVLALEDYGESVSLLLATRFIAHFAKTVNTMDSVPVEDFPEHLCKRLEKSVPLAESYTFFLDSIGSDVPPAAVFRKDGIAGGWFRYHPTGTSAAPPSSVPVNQQSHRHTGMTSSQAVALAGQLMAQQDSAGTLLSSDPRDSEQSGSSIPEAVPVLVTASGSSLCPPGIDRSSSGLFHLQPGIRGTTGTLAQCAICLQPMRPQEDLVRSNNPACGRHHVFHSICLPDSVLVSGCPLCRAPVTEPKRFRIPTPFLTASAAVKRQRVCAIPPTGSGSL